MTITFIDTWVGSYKKDFEHQYLLAKVNCAEVSEFGLKNSAGNLYLFLHIVSAFHTCI
jgi:hypothetical protein